MAFTNRMNDPSVGVCTTHISRSMTAKTGLMSHKNKRRTLLAGEGSFIFFTP